MYTLLVFSSIQVFEFSINQGGREWAKAKAPTSQKNPAWVVTVGAMKGGAGKAMVVDNIAGCLAERYKVLVVDADPQANASKGVGIDIADPDMTTLADVLTNQGTPPEDAVIRAPLRDLPNLDVMPSSILLFKTEFELAAKRRADQAARLLPAGQQRVLRPVRLHHHRHQPWARPR